MNKHIKYMALAVVIAAGFAAQASAASVSVQLGNGVSISFNDGNRQHVKHKEMHHMKDRHHLDHCKDCRRQAERADRRQHHANSRHHK